MGLNRIKSFDVNHDVLVPGMYISRIDDGIITYDLRLKKPNSEPVIENGALHTIEHLFATYVRNTEYSKNIVYFGPMGCRTGFYFITRGIPHKTAIELTQKAFRFIADFEGEIPGSHRWECGNYREHDLSGAKKEAVKYLEVIKNYAESELVYPQ